MNERDFYLDFSLISGIGPKTFALLIQNFKTAEKAWSATANELKNAGFTPNFVLIFEKLRLAINVNIYKDRLKL